MIFQLDIYIYCCHFFYAHRFQSNLFRLRFPVGASFSLLHTIELEAVPCRNNFFLCFSPLTGVNSFILPEYMQLLDIPQCRDFGFTAVFLQLRPIFTTFSYKDIFFIDEINSVSRLIGLPSSIYFRTAANSCFSR